MDSYLPNALINLRLNFNFEKLVKCETPLCGFAKVGLKGGENILECLKSLHCYLPNVKINLRSNFNSQKLVKTETMLYGSDEVGIKGGEIFWNISKFHVHACLSNGHSNL